MTEATMKLTLAPTADRVVVRRIDTEQKTKGGILIPDNAQEKPTQGTVIAVGPGRYENGVLIEMTVKPDDIVLFGKWSGTEFDDMLIMRESDILGVVTYTEAEQAAA